jgi:hypothetical protein
VSRANELLAAALELQKSRPSLPLAEAVAVASRERVATFAKSTEPTTLEAWADARLAQRVDERVVKCGESRVVGLTEVAKQHRGLGALRFCAFARLEKSAAVVALTKCAAAERDPRERDQMIAMLAELR